MKVAQLFEDDSEKTFQLRLALKQLHKLGFSTTFMDETSFGVPVNIKIPGPTKHSTQSVAITYVESSNRPWLVTWYDNGAWMYDGAFDDFADVVDDVLLLNPSDLKTTS